MPRALSICLCVAALAVALAASAQTLPDAPVCNPPSRLSYISPIVRDQCGFVNSLSTKLLIAGGVESVVNFSSGVYQYRQGFVDHSGPKFTRHISGQLLAHPVLGGIETAVSQMISNIAANHTARHRESEHIAHIESAVLLAGRIAGTIFTYRAYSKFKNGRVD